METNLSKKQSAGKSLEESKRLRDLGNLKYAKADVKGSLKLYTESIICAPHGSRELLSALGNRSAASFRLHNYEVRTICLLRLICCKHYQVVRSILGLHRRH